MFDHNFSPKAYFKMSKLFCKVCRMGMLGWELVHCWWRSSRFFLNPWKLYSELLFIHLCFFYKLIGLVETIRCHGVTLISYYFISSFSQCEYTVVTDSCYTLIKITQTDWILWKDIMLHCFFYNHLAFLCLNMKSFVGALGLNDYYGDASQSEGDFVRKYQN